MDTGTFSGVFCGPRTRAGISEWLSFTGFIRDNISGDTVGDSTASQSSVVICLGLRFIILLLAFVCSAQTYYSDCFSTKSINQYMRSFADISKRNPSFLAVIKTIINGFKGCIPFKIRGRKKIDVMAGKVGGSFLFVPFIWHRLKCTTNKCVCQVDCIYNYLRGSVCQKTDCNFLLK